MISDVLGFLIVRTDPPTALADDLELPATKLDRLKRGRSFALAWGITNAKLREMREFLKTDPVMRYAATTGGFFFWLKISRT